MDLSGGHQPFTSTSGNIHCVVNGELYDFKSIRSDLENKGHTFSTKGDSEIALHLYEEYGLSFVDHLRGEFVVCIWDARMNRFIAVRDRFGIKPLHYTVANNTLMLASEMKAFMPLGWKPEWDVSSLIHSAHFFGNSTCFKNVLRVNFEIYTCLFLKKKQKKNKKKTKKQNKKQNKPTLYFFLKKKTDRSLQDNISLLQQMGPLSYLVTGNQSILTRMERKLDRLMK
jgi:asparagine synthetase B (glutamine-hydrolysing)